MLATRDNRDTVASRTFNKQRSSSTARGSSSITAKLDGVSTWNEPV